MRHPSEDSPFARNRLVNQDLQAQRAKLRKKNDRRDFAIGLVSVLAVCLAVTAVIAWWGLIIWLILAAIDFLSSNS